MAMCFGHGLTTRVAARFPKNMPWLGRAWLLSFGRRARAQADLAKSASRVELADRLFASSDIKWRTWPFSEK
jgi:hypothetical protein